MSLYLSLPDELLHVIIEYLAYSPKVPKQHSRSLFKHASPELVALSAANWHKTDVTKLENHLALFSSFTKYLIIGVATAVSKTGDEIILSILPHFKQLLYVELLNCSTRTALLERLLAQSSVTSVLVNELPNKLICNRDLSKVMLVREKSTQAFSPRHEKYFNQGMRLACLELIGPDTIQSQFGSKVIPGLAEIQTNIELSSFPFSFLPVLSSTHSMLNKIWFNDTTDEHYLDTPSSIYSFVVKCQQQDVKKFFTIGHLSLCRAINQSSQECNSLDKILISVASSFSKLDMLTLHLNYHNATYYINDFATAFGQFSSLRVLCLYDIFKRIDFGKNMFLSAVRSVDATNAFDVLVAHAETGLLWYASKVARAARSLDAIYIEDTGYEHENYNTGKKWSLDGWLHVVNGNRDISGILRRATDEIHLNSRVLLATRMLPLGLLEMNNTQT
ncbi:hypothetical protein EV360DRAFT_70818 [Lentinula raphanica]|nr:hypothetical protein EV360DRAFT_70818 [Lentinula raphanica]